MANNMSSKQSLRHASQAIVITRQNLIAVCGLCVKSILDKACFQDVDEASLDLQNFLNIIETVFFFQFKGNIDSKRNPYTVLRSCAAAKGTVELFHTIESIDKLNHFIGRFRGAIRLALMNKCLYQLLETLLTKRSVIELHYFEDSVFRCPDAAALVSQLAGLDALDLSFDLHCPRLLEQLCYPRTCPIDYAAYMRLQVSDEAKLDDQIELATDASSSEAVAAVAAAVSNLENSEQPPLPDCPHCDWRARYLRVEAQLKRTAEQKSYLEELNKRIIEERDAAILARESAKTEQANEIKLYENVVLELQVQLTLLQEQYNRQLAAAASGHQAGGVHAGDGVTKPRLAQLDRQDSDPLPRVSVNDEACEIEAQEFDDHTVTYRAPTSDSQAEIDSEAFGYTEDFHLSVGVLHWQEIDRRRQMLAEAAASSGAEATSAGALTFTGHPFAATASADSNNTQQPHESSNDSSELVKVDSACDSAEIISSHSDAEDFTEPAIANPEARSASHLLADPSYYSLMPAVNTSQSGQSESPAANDQAS